MDMCREAAAMAGYEDPLWLSHRMLPWRLDIWLRMLVHPRSDASNIRRAGISDTYKDT
jgi:hypothetical protein